MVEGPSAALQLLSDLAAPVESPSPAPPSAGLGGAAPSRRRSAVGGRSCSVRRAHTRTSAREPAGTRRVRDAEEGDATRWTEMMKTAAPGALLVPATRAVYYGRVPPPAGPNGEQRQSQTAVMFGGLIIFLILTLNKSRGLIHFSVV